MRVRVASVATSTVLAITRPPCPSARAVVKPPSSRFSEPASITSGGRGREPPPPPIGSGQAQERRAPLGVHPRHREPDPGQSDQPGGDPDQQAHGEAASTGYTQSSACWTAAGSTSRVTTVDEPSGPYSTYTVGLPVRTNAPSGT